MTLPEVPDIELPEGFTLVSAATNPEIWEEYIGPDDPLGQIWPPWIDRSGSTVRYIELLDQISGLAPYQFSITKQNEHGEAKVVAQSLSTPFFQPGLEDGYRDQGIAFFQALPDGGYDTMLARGILQAMARGEDVGEEISTEPMTADQEQDQPISSRSDPPNLLSALSISVLPEYRSLGLATVLIKAMKDVARQSGFPFLVVPLRPTRKHEYPNVPMSEYITWRLDMSNGPVYTSHGQAEPNPDRRAEAFDPWLRKHLRLGAQIIKVAPTSFYVEGSAADWQDWEGPAFPRDPSEKARANPGLVRDGEVDVLIDRGLVPMRWNIEDKIGRYKEPNIWVCHTV